MSANEEVRNKVKEFLTKGDTHGAAMYIEDLMRSATRRETTFYSIYFPVPHPLFGELSPLEWAVLNNDEELFTIVKNYGQTQTPVLYNFYDVSLEYLAALSGFKLTLPRAGHSGRRSSKFLVDNYSPLMVAASLGHVQVMEKTGQESDWTQENDGAKRKPIDIAALHNRVEACRYLLQNEHVRKRSETLIHLSDFGNALHIAARFGHALVLNVLLDEHKVPASWGFVEARDKLNYTALGLAVLFVHVDAVQELVVHGKADVHATQGANNQTLLQIILSNDCKFREEYFVTDKFSRDKIIHILLEAGASQEGLTKEQIEYINELHERDAQRHVDDTMVEEQEPILSLKTSSDAIKPPDHKSPNKKEPLECLLCDKKFTSTVSLQAHLKSKGHVKQERKDRLQKRTQPLSTQELDNNERKRIGLIERLPLLSELINLILAKLNKQNLRRFAATSKSIQMIVEKQKLLWSELSFQITWSSWEKHQDKPSFFTDIAHKLPMVEKIKVELCNASDEVYNSFFDIPRLCTSLRELDINAVYRDYPVSWLGGVFQKNTRLTSLKVHRIIPWKRAKVQAVKDGELTPEQPQPAPANPKKPWKKKKVKQVKKPDPRKWVVDIDNVLQSGSTSLQHLALDVGFPEDVPFDIISDLIVGIFKRCPNLTSMKLYHSLDNESITSIVLKKMLYGIFDACPKLKKVRLEGEWLFGRLSNAEYDEMFKKFGAFESFKLEGSEISNFDRDIHDYLDDYCKDLKSLKILHTGEIGFNGPYFGLSGCSNLTAFGILKSGDLVDGSDQFLHTMTTQCTKIQKLKLELRPVNTAIVQGIAQLGTSLRILRCPEQSRNFYVNFSPLVRCINLTRLELQRITISDTYTIIEHCKKIQNLDLYIISDEENPANQPQQNNNNQVPPNNNNNNQVAPNNNNNVQQPNNNENNAVQEGENNNNAANNNEEQNVADNQEGAQQQEEGANNNNNPAPAPPPAPVVHTDLDLGLILEKCTELSELYLCAPFSLESFNHMTVHTNLTKIKNLASTEAKFTSDWPFFYIAECCPNLTYLGADYSFTVTDACEPIFVRRFPRLETFQGSTSRYSDFFRRVNQQRKNPFFFDF